MGRRLNEAAQSMGDPAKWEGNQQDGVELRDALLLSARYLAWHATMGSITMQYIDRLDMHINSERHKNSINGGGHQNLGRLRHERSKGLAGFSAPKKALTGFFFKKFARNFWRKLPAKMKTIFNFV